jgi:putative zinc finger/helix-turn-helix YgiT family protein
MSEIVCPNCGKSQESFRGDYQYLESGLDNVTICDIEMIKCNCGDESALIPRILAVHEAISNCLLEKDTQLTGKEIRFLRKEMGLRGKDFANLVSIDNATLSRWENGKTKPSVKADRLIRVLYAIKMKPAKELASITFKPISRGQSEIAIHVMTAKKEINLAFKRANYALHKDTDYPILNLRDKLETGVPIAADNYGYALAA